MSEVIPCSFSSVVISMPELQMGETCMISIGGTEEEITVDNSSNSNGFGMGGMQQGGLSGGMPGGRGGRTNRFDGNQSDADIEGGRMRDWQKMPEMPEMQEMPELSEMPNRQRGQNGMGGDWRNEDQPMQWGQNHDWMPDNEVAEISVISSETLILTGASILFLLAGTLIALKVEH